MQIQKKMTLLFILIVAFIFMLTSISIYILFSQSRKEEFYDRLSSKAKLVAQMLIDIDEIDTELLRKIERNNPLSLPNEKIAIYDFENQLIYTSDADTSFLFNKNILNEVRLEGEIKLKRKNYEIAGNFYTGQFDRIVVFVGANDIFGKNKMRRLRVILLFVFAGSLVVVFVSGRIFAKRALMPISHLIAQVDKIETSNLRVRIDEGNGKDEISKLSQTFNHFLERLESSMVMQKNFISNASHELRTPLTIMSGNIEVMLLKDRNTEEYVKLLSSTLEELRNITDISNRLLLLAQASSEMAASNFASCRVDDLIWQSRQEIMNRRKHYRVEVLFENDITLPASLTVNGNKPLLKTAFYNLIDNGCKYSSTNKVAISFHTNVPGYIGLRFSDHGIGIGEEDLKNIFQPFYRSKEALTIKGHGIGLSLVEKIITLHKGQIEVKSTKGNETVFSIWLPLSV